MLPALTQKFYKMQGSGNDFIIVDNRSGAITPNAMPSWAKALCPRAFRIGADGIIFLETDTSGQASTRWHFFNADGSRAQMCGNGARCATFLGHALGMAPADHIMRTDAGLVQAKVFAAENTVEVQLTPVRDQRLHLVLELDDQSWTTHFANTGVPHAVVLTDNVKDLDLGTLGPQVRYHPSFAPEGANANFIEIVDHEHLYLRTYERGVENETYACGTGAAASVVVAHSLGLVKARTQVTTSGGENLEISLRGQDIFLRGQVQLVYRGEFDPTQMGL